MKPRNPEYRRIKRSAALKEVLDMSPWLKRLGVMDGDKQVAIFSRWEKIVGGPVARNTQPLKFSKGVLQVAASTPAWLQNLDMMKPQLLANLQRELGKGVVKEIRFRAAQFDMGKLKQ